MSDRPEPPASRPSRTGGEPAAASSDTATADPEGRDLVYVHGRTEDGALRVIRSRQQRLEVGEMRAPREGQPIVGELVQLRPTEEHDQLFECETILATPRASSGPPQVASDAYRSGWDLVFGPPADDDGRDEPSDLN